MSGRTTYRTSTRLSPRVILRAIVTLRAIAWLPIVIAWRSPLGLRAFAIFLLALTLGRHFPLAGIDVLIIHGVLDGRVGTCHNLGDLILLFMEFELDQEL